MVFIITMEQMHTSLKLKNLVPLIVDNLCTANTRKLNRYQIQFVGEIQ